MGDGWACEVIFVGKHGAGFAVGKIAEKSVDLVDYFVVLDVSSYGDDDVAAYILICVVIDHYGARDRLDAFDGSGDVSA